MTAFTSTTAPIRRSVAAPIPDPGEIQEGCSPTATMASRKASAGTASLRPAVSGSYSDPDEDATPAKPAAAASAARARIIRHHHHHPAGPAGEIASLSPSGATVVSNGTILFMFLLVGLFFTLLDCLYMFHYVSNDRHASWDHAESMWQRNVEQTNAAGTEKDASHPDLTHEKRQKNRQRVAKKDTEEDKDDDDGGLKNKQPPKLKQALTPEEQTELQAILNDPERSRLVQLLTDAQIDLESVPIQTLRQLPKWSDVSALYGDRPVILGLERCQEFQRLPDPAEHFVATAGTFNTGTNLMAELLMQNCRMPARIAKYGPDRIGVRWQVLWGKHTPVFNETYRLSHRTYEDKVQPDYMLPAVMVRDPYKWMISMCRHEYGAMWRHSEKHCPNLVPNHLDPKISHLTETGGIPVDVMYKEFTVQYDTLVGFWNDWYSQYANVTWPRLLIRFEDLIFYPTDVTRTACECAGGEINPDQPFKFVVESAKHGNKAHGKDRTGYIDALVKYGTEAGRYKGYDAADLEYARKYLSPELMAMFQYKLAPPPPAAATG